jgi:hypothetical protein
MTGTSMIFKDRYVVHKEKTNSFLPWEKRQHVSPDYMQAGLLSTTNVLGYFPRT